MSSSILRLTRNLRLVMTSSIVTCPLIFFEYKMKWLLLSVCLDLLTLLNEIFMQSTEIGRVTPEKSLYVKYRHSAVEEIREF